MSRTYDEFVAGKAAERQVTDRQHDKLRAFMRMARDVATLSTCKRAPTGALLVPADFSEVVAIGYNGPAAGEPNDSCTGLVAEAGGCGCFHAEENCLVKARRHSAAGLTMLVTRAPCARCAGLMLNSRAVARVVWADPSAAGEGGLELLRRRNVVEWRLE